MLFYWLNSQPYLKAWPSMHIFLLKLLQTSGACAGWLKAIFATTDLTM